MFGRNLGVVTLVLLAAGAVAAWFATRPAQTQEALTLIDEPLTPEAHPTPPPPVSVAEPAASRAAGRPADSTAAVKPANGSVRVLGRVLGRDQAQLAGAQVLVELTVEDRVLAAAATTTGADGGYELPVALGRRRAEGLAWREAGRVRVTARAPGHWAGRAEAAAGAPDGEPVRVDVLLQRGSIVSVRLVVPEGRSMTNPSVLLMDESSGARQVVWQSATQPEAITAEAQFLIPITTAGVRMLEASAEGGGTGSFGPFLVDPSADVRLPDLLLLGEGRIQGQAVHVSGPAFEGLSLRIEADPTTLADTKQPGVVAGTVRSRAGGRFDFTGLRPGRYRVRPGEEPAKESDPWIPTGTVDARVVVAKTRLRVFTDALDGTGLTLAVWSFVGEAAVHARRSSQNSGKGVPEGLEPLASETVPLDRYWETLVPPGSLLFLRLRARDGRRAEQWLQIPTGGATDEWAHLTLPGAPRGDEAGTVVLRLAGDQDWPANTRARLFGRRNQVIEFAPGEAGHDLMAVRVPSGRHRLLVEPGTGPLNRILPGEQTVEVKAGGTTVVEFTPVVGGRVQLTVVALRSDGRPADDPVPVLALVARAAAGAATVPLGECVHVTNPSGGSWHQDMRFTSGQPFLCGRALPAGRYLIELEAEGYRPANGAVDVVAGQVTGLELVLRAR